MKKWLILVITVTVVFLLVGCGKKMVKVFSGEKATCSDCGKIINSDIKTMMVSEQDAAKYSVHEKTQICSDCQAKIAAKKQEEARQIQLKKARQIQAQKASSSPAKNYVGTWSEGRGMFSYIIVINSDGTGLWSTASGSLKIVWNDESDHIVIKVKDRSGERTFSGKLSDDGNGLTLSDNKGSFILVRQGTVK